jgi:hypothetical protein
MNAFDGDNKITLKLRNDLLNEGITLGNIRE